jgi:hypothetical protein
MSNVIFFAFSPKKRILWSTHKDMMKVSSFCYQYFLLTWLSNQYSVSERFWLQFEFYSRSVFDDTPSEFECYLFLTVEATYVMGTKTEAIFRARLGPYFCK